MGRLEGKTALITGGARGAGRRGGPHSSPREGANVVLSDVLDAAGERTADTIGGTFIHHDVTSEDEWAAVVVRTVELHGAYRRADQQRGHLRRQLARQQRA